MKTKDASDLLWVNEFCSYSAVLTLFYCSVIWSLYLFADYIFITFFEMFSGSVILFLTRKLYTSFFQDLKQLWFCSSTNTFSLPKTGLLQHVPRDQTHIPSSVNLFGAKLKIQFCFHCSFLSCQVFNLVLNVCKICCSVITTACLRFLKLLKSVCMRVEKPSVFHFTIPFLLLFSLEIAEKQCTHDLTGFCRSIPQLFSSAQK